MRHAAIWAASFASTLALLGWSGRVALHSRGAAAAARADLALDTEAAREIGRLRALAPLSGGVAAPASELPTHVTAALASCGLPAGTMSSFGAQAGGRGPGEPGERATLVLGSVTLPQAGKFLAAWRESRPDWPITSIELTPAGKAPAGGGDLPLQAVLGLESLAPGGASGATP